MTQRETRQPRHIAANPIEGPYIHKYALPERVVIGVCLAALVFLVVQIVMERMA